MENNIATMTESVLPDDLTALCPKTLPNCWTAKSLPSLRQNGESWSVDNDCTDASVDIQELKCMEVRITKTLNNVPADLRAVLGRVTMLLKEQRTKDVDKMVKFNNLLFHSH
jgi:hypothetical protein